MFGAAGEHVVDVRFVGQNFFPAFAHRRKIFPEFFEELFFEVAVAGAAFAKSFAHLCDFVFGSEERVKLDDCRSCGVLRGFDRRRIGHDAHDAFSGFLFVAEDIDGVVVTLAHFLAIQSRHDLGGGLNTGLGQLEQLPGRLGLAECLVHFHGQIARDFDVLFLIFPDRHDIAVVD